MRKNSLVTAVAAVCVAGTIGFVGLPSLAQPLPPTQQPAPPSPPKPGRPTPVVPTHGGLVLGDAPVEPGPDPEYGPEPMGIASGPCPGNATKTFYAFPTKPGALPAGQYWWISSDHSSANNPPPNSRDMNVIRWDAGSKKWSNTQPGYKPPVGPQKAPAPGSPVAPNGSLLAFGTKLYSMADGEIVACWRNAPENPGVKGALAERDGCDESSNIFKIRSCTIPRSGNFVVIKTKAKDYLLMAHLKSGSIPATVCPNSGKYVKDANADGTLEDGLFYEDVYVPENKRKSVKRGDYIGLLGNAGASSGPHLHIQRVTKAGCPTAPLWLDNLETQTLPNDGVLGDWSVLSTQMPPKSARAMFRAKED